MTESLSPQYAEIMIWANNNNFTGGHTYCRFGRAEENGQQHAQDHCNFSAADWV
jgi:hypothetical protein